MILAARQIAVKKAPGGITPQALSDKINTLETMIF
jgi:hypothetical protein